MTSFVLPDSLTGRTGTEEALTILSSGVAQPWQPLGTPHLSILKFLTSLTPKRTYYPDESIKTLKTEHWNVDLTPSIQHEDFMPVVDGILARSERLRQFFDLPLPASSALAAAGPVCTWSPAVTALLTPSHPTIYIGSDFFFFCFVFYIYQSWKAVH